MAKRNWSSFAGGLLCAVLLLGCTAGALAASGKVSFNGLNLAMNGGTLFHKGEDLTLDSGEKVPSSILYEDESGGGTTYVPLAYVSRRLNLYASWWGDLDLVVLASGPDLSMDRLGDPVTREADERLAKQWLVDWKYPCNSKGESYGPENIAYLVGGGPDYIPAVADNGENGYLRYAESAGYWSLPPEARSKVKPVLTVYDVEGNPIGTKTVETIGAAGGSSGSAEK